jgi:hypothetical protein
MPLQKCDSGLFLTSAPTAKNRSFATANMRRQRLPLHCGFRKIHVVQHTSYTPIHMGITRERKRLEKKYGYWMKGLQHTGIRMADIELSRFPKQFVLNLNIRNYKKNLGNDTSHNRVSTVVKTEYNGFQLVVNILL